MKLRAFSIIMAMFLVLVGCQGYINDGKNNDMNNNIEPTRNMGDNRDNLDTNDNENKGGFVNKRDTDQTNQNNVSNIDNRNNEYDVSEEAADKIVDEIEEISRAYVLTTNNNAYVAAMMDSNDNKNKTDRQDSNNRENNSNARADRDRDTSEVGNDLTDEVKRNISDIVQSVDQDIENVYVTTNPDFADLTDDYMNQMNDGKPIRGFFDQIGKTIERVFPQDKR